MGSRKAAHSAERGAGRPTDLFDQVVDLHFSIEHSPLGTTEDQIRSAMAAALDAGLLTDHSAFPDEIDDDWRD